LLVSLSLSLSLVLSQAPVSVSTSLMNKHLWVVCLPACCSFGTLNKQWRVALLLLLFI
jgi:hypothetical protein